MEWRGVGVPREMRDGRVQPVERKDDEMEELLRVVAVIYIGKCIMGMKNVKGKMMRDEGFVRRRVVVG